MADFSSCSDDGSSHLKRARLESGQVSRQAKAGQRRFLRSDSQSPFEQCAGKHCYVGRQCSNIDARTAPPMKNNFFVAHSVQIAIDEQQLIECPGENKNQAANRCISVS